MSSSAAARIDVDHALAEDDIDGSLAHARALERGWRPLARRARNGMLGGRSNRFATEIRQGKMNWGPRRSKTST